MECDLCFTSMMTNFHENYFITDHIYPAAKDACIGDPCQNGATCLNQYDFFICTCPPGWTGSNCQKGMCEA